MYQQTPYQSSYLPGGNYGFAPYQTRESNFFVGSGNEQLVPYTQPLPDATIVRYFNGADFFVFFVLVVVLEFPSFFVFFKKLGYTIKGDTIWNRSYDIGNTTILLLWSYIFGSMQSTFDLISLASMSVSIFITGLASQWNATPNAHVIIEHSCSLIGIILASQSIREHILYSRMYGEPLISMELTVPAFVASVILYRYYLLYLSEPIASSLPPSSDSQSLPSGNDQAQLSVNQSIASWKLYFALSLLTQANSWAVKIFTGFTLGAFIQNILFNGF